MTMYEKQNGINTLWLLISHIGWKMKQNSSFVKISCRPLS